MLQAPNNYAAQGGAENRIHYVAKFLSWGIVITSLVALSPMAGLVLAAFAVLFLRSAPVKKLGFVLVAIVVALVSSTIDRVSDVERYLHLFAEAADSGLDFTQFGSEIVYPSYLTVLGSFATQDQYLFFTALLFAILALSLSYRYFGPVGFSLMLFNPALYQAPLFSTRQTFAMLFVLTAICVFRRERGKLFMFVVAVLTHTSSAIFMVISYATRIVRVNFLFQVLLILVAIVFPVGSKFAQLFSLLDSDLQYRYAYYGERLLASIPIYSPLILFPLLTWFAIGFSSTKVKHAVSSDVQVLMYFSLLFLIYFREIGNLGSRMGLAVIVFFPLYYSYALSVCRGGIRRFLLIPLGVMFVLQFFRWLVKNDLGLNEISFNGQNMINFWGL